MLHIFPIRVYYEDTDSGGVVYYANYLKFAERARSEWLRAAGIEQHKLFLAQKMAFVVRSCAIEYFRPAMLDDLLTIASDLHDISRAKIIMRQAVLRNDEKLAELEVKLVMINTDKGSAIRVPADIIAAMKDKNARIK